MQSSNDDDASLDACLADMLQRPSLTPSPHDAAHGVLHERGVLALPPLGRASYLLRGDNGTVAWVTTRTRSHRDGNKHDDDNDDDEDDDDVRHTRVPYKRAADGSLGLLGGVSMSALLQTTYASMASDKQQRQQQQQQQQQQTQWQRSTARALDYDTDTQRTPSSSSSSRATSALWVDKYAPRSFRELLSDDAVGLQLLQWLKSWDACVFGNSNNNNSSSSSTTTTSGAATAAAAAARVHQPALPPCDRVAVLAGPAGVGKTTLVHILARHCGYEVVEVNASVERTAARLDALIKMVVSPAVVVGSSSSSSTMTMAAERGSATTPVLLAARRVPTAEVHNNSNNNNSTTTSSMTLADHLLRAKCLVLDEVDGMAHGTALQLLLQQQHNIRRPVFCLCNDLYAPVLRPLRQACHLVLRLPPVRPQRLLARLQHIAAREQLRITHAALAELVHASNGDVRSCLNTLQFLACTPPVVATAAHNEEEEEHKNDNNNNNSAVTFTPELLRRWRGKSAQLDVYHSWQVVFARYERLRAVQLLRSEHGIDYDALAMASAAAAVAEQQQQQQQQQQQHDDAHAVVVTRFRVSANYMYVAQCLLQHGVTADDSSNSSSSVASSSSSTSLSASRTSSLLDGLHENYVRQVYSDYNGKRTAAFATQLSWHNVLHSTALQRAQSLLAFVDRYERVGALVCHVCCSNSNNSSHTGSRVMGGAAYNTRITYPRGQAQMHERQASALHTVRRFRDACCTTTAATTATATATAVARPVTRMSGNVIAPWLWCSEVLAGELCPLLRCCLVDGAVRLPSHAVSLSMGARLQTRYAGLSNVHDSSSSSNNNNADVMSAHVHAAVLRHLVYGLRYEPCAASDVDDMSADDDNHGGHGDKGVVEWQLQPAIDTLSPYYSSSSSSSSLYDNDDDSSSSTRRHATRRAAAALPCDDAVVRAVLASAIQHEALRRQRGVTTSVAAAATTSSSAAATSSLLSSSSPPLHSSLQHVTSSRVNTAAATTTSAFTAADGARGTSAHKRTRDNKDADENDDEATHTASSSSTAHTTASTPPRTTLRDFFVRRSNATTATATTTTKTTTTAMQNVRQTAHVTRADAEVVAKSRDGDTATSSMPQARVRYVYQDGTSNAVRMYATLRDFV